MELGEDEKEKEEKDFFGDDYQNLVDNIYNNPSLGTGKNETGADSPHYNGIFEKINLDKYPQTELSKDGKKEKTNLKHKNSVALNSSKELDNILNKKTNRDEKKNKKKRKTKTEMDITLKNKTEINCEEKKKENEKKIYEMFNQEPFFDVYGNADEIGPSGDLYDMMNNDEANPEVNQTKSVYTTQLNVDIQEAFNMVLTSSLNK